MTQQEIDLKNGETAYNALLELDKEKNQNTIPMLETMVKDVGAKKTIEIISNRGFKQFPEAVVYLIKQAIYYIESTPPENK